jgi:hypothetical protein
MTMIDPEKYKDYIETPYEYDTGSTTIAFPTIEAGKAKRLDKKSVEKLKNAKVISTDPRIKELKKIWPDADASNW